MSVEPASSYPTESFTTTDWRVEDDPLEQRLYVTHTFVWPVAPVTMNAAHNGKANRWILNGMIAEWRDGHEMMARGCAALEWCHITVDHLTATRRKTDPVACAPSYKAALDGIRRGGVIVDDGPDYVRTVTFNAPVYAGYDALIVTLDGPAKEAA
jgi:hypothetical protein